MRVVSVQPGAPAAGIYFVTPTPPLYVRKLRFVNVRISGD